MTGRKKRRFMERKIVERLLAGTGVNQICRELGVSKHRVALVRAKAEEAQYLDGSVRLPPYPEALFPDAVDGRSGRGSAAWRELAEHIEWITERLESGWHAVTVYEELPVRVPRSSFYRFLTRHRLNDRGRALRRVVPEIVHMPGEALLIDWGYLWMIEEAGQRVKLWAFIGILGYSRYMVVRLMSSCDTTQTLAELGAMYQELGGVPLRTTSDNAKVFAQKADRYEPVLNPLYERFASHYGTIIECLPPSSPAQKGKVERPVPYVRRLLEAYAGDRNDVAAIQHYLDKKIALANQRRHGTTNERPLDRFKNEEQIALKPLPPLAYEVAHYHEGTVRRDGHVRFAGKYYSVCEDYVNKAVSVIGTLKQVAIYHAGKLIETHERVTDRARAKSTKRHHLKPWEQVCNNPDGLRSLGAKIGPSVEALIRRVLLDGDGFINFRRIWGILSLDKKYTHEELNSACDEALETQVYSSRAIEQFIIRAREERHESSPSPARPAGKFQRDITEYTQLLINLGKPIGGTYEH
jgi:hypothetical protein